MWHIRPSAAEISSGFYSLVAGHALLAVFILPAAQFLILQGSADVISSCMQYLDSLLLKLRSREYLELYTTCSCFSHALHTLTGHMRPVAYYLRGARAAGDCYASRGGGALFRSNSTKSSRQQQTSSKLSKLASTSNFFLLTDT